MTKEEAQRRAENVKQANFSVNLEGFIQSPEQEQDFNQYILGEIDLNQVIARTLARTIK